MFFKKIGFFLLGLIVYVNTILSSITSGTLIKTPHGYVAAENITIGDTLTSYDHHCLSTAKVTHISSTTTNALIAITTNKGTFYAYLDQQFFDPILQKWIAAKDITTKNTFLDTQLNHCACLHVEMVNVTPTKIYHLSTTSPHTFFATEQELLTHNALPIIIGIAWLFGEGLKFAGITIGTAILGSYIGVQLYNAQKQKAEMCNASIHAVPCGNPCPDPDDDKNKERVFNTVSKTEFFQKVEKHYEYYKDNIYKRKKGADGIENAEYLKWDKLHNDVEAYAKNKWHMGSIDPKNLRIYKGPKHAKLKI